MENLHRVVETRRAHRVSMRIDGTVQRVVRKLLIIHEVVGCMVVCPYSHTAIQPPDGFLQPPDGFLLMASYTCLTQWWSVFLSTDLI